ncbi:MAG: oligosaccharide flippase family protein [Anaerolineae bacterium]|nr:oligosaccharide flippase family protein [Anaerolineae bacterium]
MIQNRFSRWRQDNLLRRVLRNSAYLFSSNAVSAALAFVQGILATRLIGVDGFGLANGTIIMFASNVNNLLSFRMSEAMVKFYGDALQAGAKERAAAIAKGIGLIEIATSVLTYLVLILLTPWAARALGKDIQTAPLFAFYGLVILANLVYETSRGVLQTSRRFDLIGRITMFQGVITAGLIVIAFVLQRDIFEILAAYLAGKIFAGITIGVFALRELNISIGSGWWRTPLKKIANWREIFTFALSTNLNGTVNLIARDSAPLVLVWLRPAEVAHLEVGYFRLALSLINTATLPIEPFIWPTYAEITRSIAERKWRETKILLRRVSLISAAWMALAGGGLALIGWWLIPFLYTPEAAPAYPALLILLMGYSFGSIFTWNRPLLLALGKPSYPLVIAAVVGVIELALAFLLVPRFGYLAQAALLSSYFIVAIGLITLRGLREIRVQESKPV